MPPRYLIIRSGKEVPPGGGVPLRQRRLTRLSDRPSPNLPPSSAGFAPDRVAFYRVTH
ncbi:MAG: hypothetical protein WCA35_00560 [Kovacikia sp.]